MTNKRDDWTRTLDKFRTAVGNEGVQKVADAIPAVPTTVYRLISGATRTPSRAVRDGIERFVREYDGPVHDDERFEQR